MYIHNINSAHIKSKNVRSCECVYPFCCNAVSYIILEAYRFDLEVFELGQRSAARSGQAKLKTAKPSH
jgi:hypothetical protein